MRFFAQCTRLLWASKKSANQSDKQKIRKSKKKYIFSEKKTIRIGGFHPFQNKWAAMHCSW